VCTRCPNDDGDGQHASYTCRAAKEYYLCRLALCAKNGERDWFIDDLSVYDAIQYLGYDEESDDVCFGPRMKLRSHADECSQDLCPDGCCGMDTAGEDASEESEEDDEDETEEVDVRGEGSEGVDTGARSDQGDRDEA